MKRLIALLIIAVMMVTALAACNSNNNKADVDATDAPATEAPATEKPTEKPTDKVEVIDYVEIMERELQHIRDLAKIYQNKLKQ